MCIYTSLLRLLGAIPRCPCYAGGPVPNHTGAGSWYDGKGSDPTTCDSAIDMLPPWAESQPTVRPGAIAWDKSYSQVFVAWKGLNVSFETALVPTIDPPADRSDRAHDLVISISIVSMSSPPSAVNASDFGIGIAARFLFSHPGEVHLQHSSDQPLRVVGAPTGLEPHAFTLLSGEPLSPSALGLNGSFLAVIELPKAPGASGSIVYVAFKPKIRHFQRAFFEVEVSLRACVSLGRLGSFSPPKHA